MIGDTELTVAGIVHVRHFGDWCERHPNGLLAWVDGQHLLDEIEQLRAENERLQRLIDAYAAAWHLGDEDQVKYDAEVALNRIIRSRDALLAAASTRGGAQ